MFKAVAYICIYIHAYIYNRPIYIVILIVFFSIKTKTRLYTYANQFTHISWILLPFHLKLIFFCDLTLWTICICFLLTVLLKINEQINEVEGWFGGRGDSRSWSWKAPEVSIHIQSSSLQCLVWPGVLWGGAELALSVAQGRETVGFFLYQLYIFLSNGCAAQLAASGLTETVACCVRLG